MRKCNGCTPRRSCDACRPQCDPCCNQPKMMYCGRNLPCVGVLRGQDLNRVVELLGDEICNLKQLQDNQGVRLLPNPDCGTGISGFIIEIYNLQTEEILSSASICEPTTQIYYEVTHSEALDLSSNNEFEVGATYGIVDADPSLYGGTKVILKAVSNNRLELKGTGVFYNPPYDENTYSKGIWTDCMIGEVDSSLSIVKFIPHGTTIITNNGAQGVFLNNGLIGYISGDWTNSTYFTYSGSNYPIQYFENIVYNIGDRIIWGGNIWENISGNIGQTIDSYELSTTDWLKINDYDYYNVEYDYITYDLNSNRILSREDNINNYVETSSYVEDLHGDNPIKTFQWGRPLSQSNINYGVIGNSVTNGGIFRCINNRADFISFVSVSGASIIDLTETYKRSFENLSFDKECEFTGNIIVNSMVKNCNFTRVTFVDNNLLLSDFLSNESNDFYFSLNYFKDTLTQGNYLKGAIDSNKLMNSSITNNWLNKSSIVFNEGLNLDIQDNKLEIDSRIEDNTNYGSSLEVFNNILVESSSIRRNSTTNSGAIVIRYNNLNGDSSIHHNISSSSNSSIENNTLKNSEIALNNLDNTFSNISQNILHGGLITGNELDSSSIRFNTIKTLEKSSSIGILNNNLSNSQLLFNSLNGKSSRIQSCDLNNSRIEDVTLNTSYFFNLTLSSNSSVVRSLFSGSILDGLNFSNKNISDLEVNGSNLIQSIIDFSSATTIFNGSISKKIDKVNTSPNTARLYYIDESTNQFIITPINS